MRLRDVRDAARDLRELAFEAVEAFRERAAEIGAPYLGNLEVSPVEPDEKHVDCVQFRVARGRLELLVHRDRAAARARCAWSARSSAASRRARARRRRCADPKS